MQRAVRAHHQVMLYLSAMVFLVHIPVVSSETPADLLVNQFFRMDSIFAASVQSIEPAGKGDSAWIKIFFRELLQQFPEFYAIIVADESGRVFSTISYETLGSDYSGIVAEKEWFATARNMESPYYGGLSWINGRYCLVWSKPSIGRTTLGIRRCKGVVMALINVAQCLQSFTADYGLPFELVHGNAIFYHSDDWRADLASHEQIIKLLGDLTFVLRYGQDKPVHSALGSRLAGNGLAGESPESSIVKAQHRRNRADDALDSGPMAFFGGATLVVMIALFLVLLIRHRNKSVLGTGLAGRQAQEPVEDRESIKRQVVADLYGEIKGRIEKYEIAKIESDVRERVQCEMRAEVMADLTDEDRAAIVREIEEEERQARRQEIAETKKDELYQEAYALALDDALSRLKKKERQRLKTEALQELVNAVEQEIKSEHEAVLRKKALCNLEERVQREVEIKERTRLTLKVREELRARLEKEVENEEVALFRRQVRKKIRKSISEPLDAVAMVTDANAEDAPDMVKRVPLSSATMDLHKGSESEALVSLAKTVSMLKKQYESSTLFKLNEAQTAAMIDYLEKISNRLNGYFTEVNDGIEQAVFGNEQDSLGTYAGKRGKFLHDESAAGHDRPDNRIEFKYPTDSRDLRTGTDE